jgi:nitrogen fixation-related uncharacterized protein
MAALIILLVVVAALAVFAIAASKWGVDSRDGFADPHRPAYPVGIN